VTIHLVYSGTVPFLQCLSWKFFDIKQDVVFHSSSRSFPDSEEIIKCDSSMIKQVHQNSPYCMQNFKNFSGMTPQTLAIGRG